jgi:hypothetical protein
MLRSNLATRPFYNERAVRIGIGVVVAIAAALTAFNVAQILTLSDRNAAFVTRAETAEARAAELRAQARATRDKLDKDDVSVVQAQAREANLLIERRAFSWTDLFNRFEETLPAEVRLVAVTPQVDIDGRMLVAATVVSRRIEDLDAFIERLELTGTFRDVLPRQDEQQDDGMLRSVIQGYYAPEAVVRAAVQPAPTSDSSGGTGNRTPTAPSAPGGLP